MKQQYFKRSALLAGCLPVILCACFFAVNAQDNSSLNKPSEDILSEKTLRERKVETEYTVKKSADEAPEKSDKKSEEVLPKNAFDESKEKSQDESSTKQRNFFNELKPRYFGQEKDQNKEKPDDKDEKKKKRIDTEEKKWEISENSIEYGVEGGFAPDIATWMSGPKPWDISGHRHLLGSLRWGKILGTRGIVTFSYAIEFTPLSVAIGNQTENKEHRTNPLAPPTKRTNNFGAAINPTSFRFIFLPQYRLRPFIFSGLGISYHLKPVPVESGTKWNLAWDFGFGGQYMLSKTKAIQFGYRYYHLSNVYLSNYNPGYNSNVYFVGYSIFKK